MNVNFVYNQQKRMRRESSEDNSSEEELSSYANNVPRPGKKTRGRVKVKMELIKSKLRRYTTFSKRKTGIMKKAYELATLTGTQVMILVASETGHVYTFATQKLQPMITSDAGKSLIQTCLNSPDPPPVEKDSRMTETGYEEVDLSYHVQEEDTNQSGSNPDDPQDSIAASYSQASSPSPSPGPASSPHAPSGPPLMTIPPHVMTQLLNTAHNNRRQKEEATPPPNPLSLHSIQATPHSKQPMAPIQMQQAPTTVTNKQQDITLGHLSFKGKFQRADNGKQILEQPRVPVFRPIVPKNKELVGAMKAPEGRYRSIAPNSIFPALHAQPQPILLTQQHQHLPIQVLPPVSHATSAQDSAPQNLSLNKRK